MRNLVLGTTLALAIAFISNPCQAQSRGDYGGTIHAGYSTAADESMIGLAADIEKVVKKLGATSLILKAGVMGGFLPNDLDPDENGSEGATVNAGVMVQLTDDLRVGFQIEKALGDFIERENGNGVIIGFTPVCGEQSCLDIEGIVGKETRRLTAGIRILPPSLRN